MSAAIVHEVVDGFCRVCGDTEAWLLERYGAEAVAPAGAAASAASSI